MTDSFITLSDVLLKSEIDDTHIHKRAVNAIAASKHLIDSLLSFPVLRLSPAKAGVMLLLSRHKVNMADR